MHLLQALLSFRLSPDDVPGDAACAIKLIPKGPGQQQQNVNVRESQCLLSDEKVSTPSAAGFKWHPFAGKATSGGWCSPQSAGCPFLISRLPPLTASLIWEQLSDSDKRSARLVQADAFKRAVGSLQVTGRDFEAKDMRQLSSTFPDINRLALQLGPDPSTILLKELRGVRLQHLHTFICDAPLKGELLLSVARFLVHTPTLRVLHLPNQRACSATDQRVLCAVVEALQYLTELNIGGAGSSRSGSNAISPSLLRRITKLLPSLQSLSCNAAGVPDEQLQSLEQLPQLQCLSVSASGSGKGLSAAVKKLTHLTNLEIQHPSLAAELVGCLGGAQDLEELALGLCPELTDGILEEVTGLEHLHRLSLPFSLSTTHLQSLSKLPQLVELLTFNSLEMDVLGPAHEPLASVTKLVTSNIDSHGKPLAALFPALQSLYLRSCGDMEALSIRSCGTGLSVLVAGDCRGLTDEGFAGFRALRGLTHLQMDNARQLSDLSFVAVFSSTLPYLHHISLSGAAHITDTALQLLTASCRRLLTINLSNCPHLTDKTLKRLSHCEHLTAVSLKACRGFTSQGVATLAAAPQLKAVNITACSGIHKSQLRGCKAGAKLRITSDMHADKLAGKRGRVSESGRSH